MQQTGFHMSNNGVDHQGLEKAAAIYWNLRPSQIYEMALARGEGEIADSGPLLVKTGAHTGRSAQDKFIVRDATTEDNVWWDNNKSMTAEQFDALHEDMLAYAEGKEFLVQDLFGGADKTHRLATRVVTELAWHSLFIQNLLIEPETPELEGFDPAFVIMNFPGFKADTARHGSRTETMIAVNFDKKIVLICGTSYAGETKKSVFSMLNYTLPPKRVMPMHCSVNVGKDGDSAVFFGLSGTGKTTLSADPNRELVGDDEHGWSENGVFNFEGGCYAKMINLSQEAEPEI
ncbi:MAG: phosphoenolpyruvate carboxykinase (ATP), partial [Alphaproteobacteria bacterium]|nr:phosphoenolpyruvate carboxykinase (ATP) [Alphaproteobacteria bacterium]